MAAEINENHKIVTVENELHFEGHFLSEMKQMIVVDSDHDDGPIKVNPKMAFFGFWKPEK